MAKSHKTCMEQAEIIDTFGMYQRLYISTNNRVVSVVVVVERMEVDKEYPLQQPIYYVSEVLTLSKQRYPHWQKLVLGVFITSQKLKHNFQEHPITVVSSAPLADIIQNREATGRVGGLSYQV